MKKKIGGMVLLVSMLLFTSACGGGTGSQATGGKKEGGEEKFPSKAVNLVVPFSAGSGADIFARTLAKEAEKHLGQPVVVENKPGGSGAIALSYLLSQPADGYTLATHSRTFSFLLADDKSSFNPDQFAYIARINGESSALMVKNDGKFKSLDGFIQYAKANPGKVKVSGPGSGSFHHMVALNLQKEADIQFTWIPYDGGKEAVLDVLGGNVDAVIATASNGKAQIDAGKLKILAVSSSKRSEKYPDVMTYKEAGYPVEEILWRGVFGKKGIPADRAKILEEAFLKALETPEWKKYMQDFAQEEAQMTSADFTGYVKTEVEKTKQFLQQIKGK